MDLYNKIFKTRKMGIVNVLEIFMDSDNDRIIEAENFDQLKVLKNIYEDAKMIIPIYKVKNNIKTLKQLRDAIETDLNENNFSNEIRNDDMITADIKRFIRKTRNI